MAGGKGSGGKKNEKKLEVKSEPKMCTVGLSMIDEPHNCSEQHNNQRKEGFNQ